MSQSPKDIRVRRSRKFIREAFIDLIDERGLEAVTVGEIIDRAMVSRATFYRNYQDKYDLVEQIFAEAMQSLFDSVSQPGTEHPPQMWVRFFEHIAEYERLYRALLGRKGSPWFVLKMRAALVELIKQYEHLPFFQSVGSLKDPASMAYARDILATLCVETIIWWLEQGRPYTAQEIARRCAFLATAIFKEIDGW
jgi:AcrR family transcriptional regulator